MKSELAELAASLLDHVEAQRLLGAEFYLPDPASQPPSARKAQPSAQPFQLDAEGGGLSFQAQRQAAAKASRPEAPASHVQRRAQSEGPSFQAQRQAADSTRPSQPAAQRPVPDPGRPAQPVPQRPAAPAARSEPLPAQQPLVSVPAPTPRASDRVEALRLIEVEASACTKCRLSETRTKVVFGTGSPDAEVVFVGEAPGQNEDLQGIPFVGDAGHLLDKIIVAMGLERSKVYICNIIKCRPPRNRQPLPDEIEQCEPYLLEQLGVLKPKVICALGTYAAQTLLRTDDSISRMRGKFFRYHEIELMPTYHPAYLLRTPSAKRMVWEDMQKVQALLGIPPGSYADKGPYKP